MASRSGSRRPQSCSRSPSSRARSTSAARSPRSRRSTAHLIAAARTLGAGPWRVFSRIAIPLAAGGLGAASALALARGLGEFGATIIFAGSLQGVTQTLPLAIYAQLDQDLDVALAISALFVVAGAAVLVGLKGLHMGTLRFDLTVPVRHFDVEVALEVGSETVALVGPSGAGKTTVLRGSRGARSTQSGTDRGERRDLVRQRPQPTARGSFGGLCLSGVRALSSSLRRAQCGLRRSRAAGSHGPSRYRGPCPGQARRSLRRRKAASRARASSCPRPQGAPARRAAGSPRHPHTKSGAQSSWRASAGCWLADDPRHARLHGRRRSRRADRGCSSGKARADRHGNRADRGADELLRRRVRGQQPPAAVPAVPVATASRR